MLQKLSRLILKAFGWNVTGKAPQMQKFVIIGAPHTSNWDFPLTLLGLTAIGLRFSWIGKHTIFKGPLGIFFKKIGGIPVNRTARTNFIDEMVDAFATRDRLKLAIAPEGTRSKKDHWKAGFYHIAVRANTKICLGYIDYPTKTIGLGPTLMPSKDIVADFEIIKAFYHGKSGKFPENESTIRLREKEIALFEKEYSKTSDSVSSPNNG